MVRLLKALFILLLFLNLLTLLLYIFWPSSLDTRLKDDPESRTAQIQVDDKFTGKFQSVGPGLTVTTVQKSDSVVDEKPEHEASKGKSQVELKLSEVVLKPVGEGLNLKKPKIHAKPSLVLRADHVLGPEMVEMLQEGQMNHSNQEKKSDDTPIQQVNEIKSILKAQTSTSQLGLSSDSITVSANEPDKKNPEQPVKIQATLKVDSSMLLESENPVENKGTNQKKSLQTIQKLVGDVLKEKSPQKIKDTLPDDQKMKPSFSLPKSVKLSNIHDTNQTGFEAEIGFTCCDKGIMKVWIPEKYLENLMGSHLSQDHLELWLWVPGVFPREGYGEISYQFGIGLGEDPWIEDFLQSVPRHLLKIRSEEIGGGRLIELGSFPSGELRYNLVFSKSHKDKGKYFQGSLHSLVPGFRWGKLDGLKAFH